MGSSLPPYKVGNLNSKLFLSEISKREKSLKRTLEGKIPDGSRTLLSGVCFYLNYPLTSHLFSPLSSLSSPYPSLDLPAVCSCVSQRSELWLWSRETETFHCLPRGERERRKKRCSRFQGLLLLFLILFFVVSQTALPGLGLSLRRGPVHQSAASRPLRPASHQRERRDRKRKRLSDQPPFRLRVWLLALSSWRQQLLALLPAGRAASIRRPEDPGVHDG